MNIVNKFLLVCLQLIIISLMSFKIVEGREVGSRAIAGRVNRLLDAIEPGPSTSRASYLYSRCSRKNVLVQDRVSATANRTDFKGILEFQTVMVMAGGVKTRIHGLYADRYICFNHKGRLVTKPKKRARGAKCEFVEELTPEGYSQFRSAKNGDWFVGFNPKGKPLLATAHSLGRAKDCFDFLKVYSNHPHRHRHNSNSNNNNNFNINSNNNNNNRHHLRHQHHNHHQNNNNNWEHQQGKHSLLLSEQIARGRVSTSFRNNNNNNDNTNHNKNYKNNKHQHRSSIDNINGNLNFNSRLDNNFNY